MADIKRAATVGTALVAALGLAVPLVQRFEGLRTTPYNDITNTKTVCYGDTAAKGHTYTPDECSVLLVARLAHDYAPAVIRCVPGLADKPNPLAASISLSYNVGASAFCRSAAAKRFNAGRWREGCDAFLAYRFAGGRESQGLLRRRRAERALCVNGL